jgi:flavin reductase (DIM6/NTAB) family NADH-FMN oxidoreductase RutF
MSGAITPSSDNARAFRDALGAFATGVTVVTTTGDIGHVGITVNSFSSVSMNPALVMWSVAKGSKRHHSFADSGPFVIHIMGQDQDDIATGFTKDAQAFDAAVWHENTEGVRVIAHCLAAFECETYAVYDGGDHSIVVGKVLRFSHNEGEGLLFNQGKYGRFI